MISNKIMKLSDGFYRYACSCSDPTCDLGLYFENDHGEYITLNMYKTLTVSDFCMSDKWYRKLYNRVSLSLKFLFTGELTAEGELVIESEEDILSLIAGLHEGIGYLKNNNNSSQ